MAQSLSTEAIKKATGKSLDDWVKLLDKAGAKEMTHTEIAQWVYDNKLAPAWWCQMVTVAYEQSIGRRVAGQNCYGEFVANSSKTLGGNLDSGLELWLKLVKGKKEFNEVPLEGQPKVSQTEKWRYWRAALADGSKISVNISKKDDAKIILQVDHANVGSQDAQAAWKAYWKEILGGIK